MDFVDVDVDVDGDADDVVGAKAAGEPGVARGKQKLWVRFGVGFCNVRTYHTVHDHNLLSPYCIRHNVLDFRTLLLQTVLSSAQSRTQGDRATKQAFILIHPHPSSLRRQTPKI